MAHVVVVGAGVIGLCAARELRKRGWDVTVVDAGKAGAGASYGNAGWVVPALSDPLPGPGLVGTTLRWMLKPNSPVYIRPRLDPALARWLFAFWRTCTERAFMAGLEATAILAERTFALYDEMEADGIDGEQERRGLIAAYHSPRALEHDLRAYERLTAFGQPAPVRLDGDALRDIEPALASTITGGVLLPAERHVRPDRLCAGLVNWLTDHGATVREHTPINGLRHGRGTVTAVETPQGPIMADAVVLAAGAWTPTLARYAGVDLPIQAGKGYSLEFSPAPIQVAHPIYLHETRVAITPFRNALRLAGTMELAGLDPQIRPARIAAIAVAATRSLANWTAQPGDGHAWAGFRPITPDGLPVIGRLPGFDNLLVASGHAMLGVTLAPVTGEAVAGVLAADRPIDRLAPFDPARFSRRA